MQLPNTERWKSRAAQVRRFAECMDPDPARDLQLAIAQQYEEAAQRYSANATRSGLQKLALSFHM
jgi:hypothetical protein